MRRVTGILILLLAAISLAANPFPKKKRTGKKHDDPPMHVTVNGGAALPFFYFGKRDTLHHNDSTKITGWAKPGIHFNANYRYIFTDHFGVMGQFGGNIHAYNSDAFLTAYQAGSMVQITSTKHYIGSYLAGPVVSFPSQVYTVQVHALAGLMTARYAKVTQTIESHNSYFIREFEKTKTFAYDAGAAIIFDFRGPLGISIGVDYLGGKPVFTTYTISANGTSAISSGHKISMTTGIVNFSAGLSLGF
jgi:hypothetical protein